MKTGSIPLLQTLLCLPPHSAHSYDVLHPPTPAQSSFPVLQLPGMAAPADLCAGCSLGLALFSRCPLNFLISSKPPPLGPTLPSLLKPAATSLIPVIIYFISKPSQPPEADLFSSRRLPRLGVRCSMPSLKGPGDPRIWPVARSWLCCPPKTHPFTLVTCPAGQRTPCWSWSQHQPQRAGSPSWEGGRVLAQQGPRAWVTYTSRLGFVYGSWKCLQAELPGLVCLRHCVASSGTRRNVGVSDARAESSS